MTRLGVAFAIAAFLTFLLGPIAYQLVTSLTPEEALLTPGLPSSWTLAHYRSVLLGRDFGKAALNSLGVATLTTVFCLVVGASGAFALARLPLRGASLLLGAAVAVAMFPPVATVSPLFLILRALGLRDSIVGLALPYTSFALPLTLWTLTSFFRQLPDDLYRAARVDGCTPFQAFRRVFLPLAAPGLATTGLLVFIFSWNELLFALTFLSSPAKRTVPVAIALFASEHREPWAEIAAASVVATLPLVVVAVLFQKRVVAGLTAGAVKE